MSYIGNQPTYAAFVTDQFSGNGGTTFTMSVAPANTASVLVAVSGVLQDPSTYSVVGTTLTFSQAPPVATANISVRYMGIPASGVTNTAYRTVTEFTATNAQTVFNVPSYTVGFINVYLNGVRLGAADFTASNGTSVTLTAGAPNGALVTTESFYVSSVLNAIPATAGAVNTSYIADNAITSAKIAAGAVTQADLATNVAGNGPLLYSGGAASISVPNVTTTFFTNFGASVYDTGNAFSAATGRFTPQTAGWYLVIARVGFDSNGITASSFSSGVYKNGSTAPVSYQGMAGNGGGFPSPQCSAIVYLNGSTDYAQVGAYHNAGANAIGVYAHLQACLMRAA